MKINHKQVSKLNSFNGVKLRGNETFDELLKIEEEIKAHDKWALERAKRIAEENANIQRVDAQVKGVKKW